VDASGTGTLQLNPVGVGYSEITLWASDGFMTGHIAFPYAASAPGRPETVWHLGASDGSTAIPVGQDFILIGDDENQTIRLYPRHQSGLPVNEFDMTSFLALPDVKPGLVREVDVEASTHVGERQFWLGSHGHATDGEPRTNRTRIFATETRGSGTATSLAYIGRYDFLKWDLINWDSHNLHGKGTNYYGLEASDAPGVSPKAPDGSGFSIEGLAMMPVNTNGAYIAFRAPIVPATNRTFALIVPVLNFATVAASTGPPGSCVFGAPIELDLYGRGIRSLEGGPDGYILVGGPAPAPIGKYPQDFRLYTWSGYATDTPDQRSADLSGLTPEGIIELPSAPWQTNSQVELLSDNGSTHFYGDDVPAKLLPIRNFKKCRTDVVSLGAVTKPMPIILNANYGSNGLLITWRALKGLTYRMQRAVECSSGVWEDIPGDVQAEGPYAFKTVPASVSPSFYRLVVLP
jgi:hypothetical protein